MKKTEIKNRIRFTAIAATVLLSCFELQGRPEETALITPSEFQRAHHFTFQLIPLIMPLEATIGRLYLGNRPFYLPAGDTLSPPVQTASLPQTREFGDSGHRILLSARHTVAPPLLDRKKDGQIRQRTAFYKQTRGASFFYRGEHTSLYFDLYHYMGDTGEKNITFQEGDLVSGRLTLGYDLGMGHSGDSSPVNLLLGVASHYYLADKVEEKRLSGTEYGTVFFVPGLQLSAKSVMLQAMFEVPVYHTIPTGEETGTDTRNALPGEDRIRANIGVKYYIH